MVNIENLISFIRYGIDNEKTRAKMLLGSIGISAFAMFACMDGFVYDMFTLVCTVVVFLLSISFIIVLSVISRVLNIKTRVICDFIITAFTIAIFSLSGKIYLYMNKISYSSLVSFVPLIFALTSFLFCYIKVKKNRYIKKNNNPNYLNLAAFAAVGVVIGTAIMRMYVDKISQPISPDTLIGVLFLLIASAFAIIGTPSFLKLYYLKILDRMGVSIDE